MTPYRDRREQGHYNADGETPDSTHAHHLQGLMTATKPPEESLPEEVEPEVEPEAEEPESETAEDLSELTKAELLDLARERGIRPANAAMSKDELREALAAT